MSKSSKPTKTSQWANGNCQGCGKPVLFVQYTNAIGTLVKMPLDPAPITFKVIRMEDGLVKVLGRADTDETTPVFVSHFSTCPNAKDFSGRNK